MADHRNDKEKFPNSKKFSEFRDEISIIELAQSIGYSMNTAWAKAKRSANFPCLESEAGDRIWIKHPRDNQRMRYQNVDVSSDEGDVISFVKNRMDNDFAKFRSAATNDIAAINAVLYDYLNIPEHVRNQYQKMETAGGYLNTGTTDEHTFNKELFKLHPPGDTEWLNRRGVDTTILQAEPFQGKVYNVQNPIIRDGKQVGHSKFVNTGFPYQESLTGNIVGLEERNFDFKGHGVNSNKHVGVWFSNPPAKIDQVILVESALDALSHYQLKKPVNAIYFSSGGQLTSEQIQTVNKVLQESKGMHSNTRILLGHDRDKDGAMYDLKFTADLLADKYPMVKAVKDKDYVKLTYATENNPRMIDFANDLMSRLQEYNRPMQQALNRLESELHYDEQQRDLLYKSIYRSTFEKGLFKIEIPKDYFALQNFNQTLLEVTGIQKYVRLEKSKGNDWNDDLMRSKQLQKEQANQVKPEVKRGGVKL